MLEELSSSCDALYLNLEKIGNREESIILRLKTNVRKKLSSDIFSRVLRNFPLVRECA